MDIIIIFLITICLLYYFNKQNIETVLINSNFSCNYIINRNKLFDILKFKYNLHALYDPCSYPGIQCKFYYNENKKIQNGICECEQRCDRDTKKNLKKKNKCKEIS